MTKDQAKGIASIVYDEVKTGKDVALLQDILLKFDKVKLNFAMKKKLAKKLNVKESTALNWKIVKDIFACVDTAQLAREHPDDAARILKTVATIVGLFFPPILVIHAFPNKVCAKIVEYSGHPTPEHIVSLIAQNQLDEEALKEVENKMKGTDAKAMPPSTREMAEYHKKYERGEITKEELEAKVNEIIKAPIEESSRGEAESLAWKLSQNQKAPCKG